MKTRSQASREEGMADDSKTSSSSTSSSTSSSSVASQSSTMRTTFYVVPGVGIAVLNKPRGDHPAVGDDVYMADLTVWCELTMTPSLLQSSAEAVGLTLKTRRRGSQFVYHWGDQMRIDFVKQSQQEIELIEFNYPTCVNLLVSSVSGGQRQRTDHGMKMKFVAADLLCIPTKQLHTVMQELDDNVQSLNSGETVRSRALGLVAWDEFPRDEDEEQEDLEADEYGVIRRTEGKDHCFATISLASEAYFAATSARSENFDGEAWWEKFKQEHNIRDRNEIGEAEGSA